MGGVTYNSKIKQIMPADYVLHRGGRIPKDLVQWYSRAFRENLIFRVKAAVSTTTRMDTVVDFIETNGYPKDGDRVHWKFYVNKDRLCKHVNCLEQYSLMRGEFEFLFPPF